MTSKEFETEFRMRIMEPFYAHNHFHNDQLWAQWIIDNAHLLSEEALEYAASDEGYEDCNWSSNVKEALSKTLEHRLIEAILLS